jgi:hypothetical protein
MLKLRSSGRELRYLDFDIENRPLTYAGNDFTWGEITAIAASFEGERKVHAFLVGEKGNSVEDVIQQFLALLEEADAVTGHYIRRHDLPIISDTMFELGYGRLDPVLASDTKVDLRTGSRVVSKSQENLGALLKLKAPKVQMNQVRWREANRLTPDGLKLTRERVVGDVKQHKQLRQALIDEGVLGPPVLWRP